MNDALGRAWQLLFEPGAFVAWLSERRRHGLVLVWGITTAAAATSMSLPRLVGDPKLASLAESWPEMLVFVALVGVGPFAVIWFLAPWVLEVALWMVGAPEAPRRVTRAVALAVDQVRSVPTIAVLGAGILLSPTPRAFVERFGPLLGLAAALSLPCAVLATYGCVRAAFGGEPRRHRVVLLAVPLGLTMIAAVVELVEFLGP